MMMIMMIKMMIKMMTTMLMMSNDDKSQTITIVNDDTSSIAYASELVYLPSDKSSDRSLGYLRVPCSW